MQELYPYPALQHTHALKAGRRPRADTFGTMRMRNCRSTNPRPSLNYRNPCADSRLLLQDALWHDQLARLILLLVADSV